MKFSGWNESVIVVVYNGILSWVELSTALILTPLQNTVTAADSLMFKSRSKTCLFNHI